MKKRLENLIRQAAVTAHQKGVLPYGEFPPVQIDIPKVEVHGDFATNIALVMARDQKMAPRKVAEAILNHLDTSAEWVDKAEIAGPGFINFFIAPTAWLSVLHQIHAADIQYGASDLGRGRKVQVEFVSSNPTGPLHVGHGRGAAVGDSVANILAFCGYDVRKEYYINDSGRQIHTLGRSVFLRYQALLGNAPAFPQECYQGDYIRDLAAEIFEQKGDTLLAVPPDEAVDFCARHAAQTIIDGIRTDLKAFGIGFDCWFSEQSLYDSGKVDACLDELRRKSFLYENEGALWFRSTRFGDEKDRVVVRRNGQTTYFASDIAYHQDKYERGFERVIDVWGADHHGYIPRMKAAVQASGRSPEQFDVILVQLVNLLRAGEPVAMSTRAGEFVTLREVLDEVGRDAARFLFLTRHYDSPLDFDLELAKQKTNENPVYYVQYVHARISSILAKGRQRGIQPTVEAIPEADRLCEPEEIGLMKALLRYPDVVAESAVHMEPHRITFYLMSLASAFHAYYNKHRVLTEDPTLTRARLYLVLAVRKVIRNGLTLLGVSAPEKM